MTQSRMSELVVNKMMYKYEVADLIGTTSRSLRRWLSHPKHKQAMLEMGVKDTAHQLPPIAINYIIDKFGVV